MTAPAVVTTPVTSAAAASPAPVVEQTPTAPVTPVEIPVTPAAAIAEEIPKGVQGMIDRITRKVTPEAIAEPLAVGDPTAPTDPAAIQTAIDPAAPTDGTPPVMVASITADEPEGEVVLRARDPKTGKFSDMDQTRTYELSIRDKQTGESRVYNKTLPELMRMAKDGIAMQKSRDELSYYREQVPQWQQTHTQIQQRADGLEALAMELLTAPEDIVVARREAYLAEQSPEKQLARLKAQIAQQNQQRADERTEQQRTIQQHGIIQQGQALAQRIGSVVQEIEGLVGREAAAGKLALDTASLMVNGRIPPEHFPQLEQYVNGPYRQWAEAEAAKRTTSQAEIERQRAATLETQRKAQLAAQLAGNATRPGGGLAGGSGQIPATKPKNVNEAMERIIRGNGRPLAAAG